MSQTSPNAPVTDSPWLWVALFSVAAIVGLVLAQGQVAQRQVTIERQTQGRARAAEMAAGGEAVTEMSTQGNTVIALEPFLMLLAGGVLLASGIFWAWRFTYGRKGAAPHAADEPPTTSHSGSTTA